MEPETSSPSSPEGGGLAQRARKWWERIKWLRRVVELIRGAKK